MSKREYHLELTINNCALTKVVIDPHYEEKHSESISDEMFVGIVNAYRR